MIMIKRGHNKRGEDHQEVDGVLTKVVAAFEPSKIVALLKAVILAESEVHSIIHALAQRQRCSNESPAQAFARFITRDPDGIKLYQILESKRSNKIKPDARQRAMGTISVNCA
jgi:hypothetical protein